MGIPMMKVHVENAIKKFEWAWNDLLLEEKRDLPHLQNCNEAIEEIHKTLNTLSLALQREIGGEI